jgi:hypothetical protein
VIRLDPRTRYAALFLVIALLASAFVMAERLRVEARSNRVELAMDYGDFLSFARSYNYNASSFLLELRRAGLTSLALSEELGSSLAGDTSPYGFAISGPALLDQARISPLANPTLLALERAGRIRPGDVYIVAYGAADFRRYLQQLPLHFERSGIHVLHTSAPYVIAVRTQIDYFNSTGLGIPADQVALANRLGLRVIPRFQNDERLSDGAIAAMFDDVHAKKMSTVIFFGLRNQVLGFPDHIADTAAAIKSHPGLNYGEIETYDPSQVQKGNVELAQLLPGRVVRVQAITKVELDKLTGPAIVARYELGVRERNVRVVYLRPFGHRFGGLSIEKTNVEILRELGDDLRGHGFRLGWASPIAPYRGNSAILVGLAALAPPSMFVLLLGIYGWYRKEYAITAYGLTVAVYLAGYFTHHDLLGRSIIALASALVFAAAAFTAFGGAYVETPRDRFWPQIANGLWWTLAATGVALLGALTIVGLLSSPLMMEEVEAFRGVRLVLGLPPLIALGLYLFTPRFDSGVSRPAEVWTAPIRVYQILLTCAVLAIGYLVFERSGNQSDIAPSSFELALRHHLTSVLSVRPRFKEFVVGFPFMMLVPALLPAHRRLAGILLALGIGVGIGDIIDTFSHLHTPIAISVIRIFYGLVLGAAIGAILIAIYRRFAPICSPAPPVAPRA